MKHCYINGMGCISAQETFAEGFLHGAEHNTDKNILSAQNPDYKSFISPAAIRRMAKGVKMGIAASHFALSEAKVEIPDAIITGTGMGCIQDSEKFLKTLLANQERYLTPTSFIQSTHNTVGAQIALRMKCKGYNFTYVNGAISLASALIDAMMQIENGEAATVLAGGVDETSAHTILLYELIGLIKNSQMAPFDVLNPTSKGAVYGEGAGFFVLENTKKESTYAILQDVATHNMLSEEEVPAFVEDFLAKNKRTAGEIDALVLGNNGDLEFDQYYNKLGKHFAQTPQMYYKHLSGEFDASASFGLWAASKVIKQQQIPEVLQKNKRTKPQYKTVLLYNQSRGRDHSLTLLNHAEL